MTLAGEGTHASKASENPTTEVPSVDSESIHDDTLEEYIDNKLLNEENEGDDEQMMIKFMLIVKMNNVTSHVFVKLF